MALTHWHCSYDEALRKPGMEGSHNWAELEAVLRIMNGRDEKAEAPVPNRPAQALLYDSQGNPLPPLEPGDLPERFGGLALVPHDAVDSTGDQVKPTGPKSKPGRFASPVAHAKDGPSFTYRDAFGNPLSREDVHRMVDLKGRRLVLPYGA